MTQDQHSIEGLMVLVRRFGEVEHAHRLEQAVDLLNDIEEYAEGLAHLQQRPLPVREGTRERIMHLMLSFGSQCHAAAKDPTDDYPRRMAENALARLEELLASPSLPVREEPTAWLCCGSLFHSYAAIPSAMLPPNGHPVPLFASSPSVQNMGEGEAGKDDVGGTDGR